MKATSRGDFEIYLEKDELMACVRWADSAAVNLVSTYITSEPVSTIQRYDAKLKRDVEVSCPAIIKTYNEFIGGVDLVRVRLHALCRMDLCRWYMRIVYYLFNVAMTNSWKIYCINNPSGYMILRKFISDVATSLMKANKITRVGRQSK
jgi:hypothetical protein